MRPLAILMLSALALLPVACERAAPARDQGTSAAASASAMEFRGERPCADCDGIEAWLRLEQDGKLQRYRLIERYSSGTHEREFKDEGEWIAEGDLLRLRARDGGERVYAYQADGSLQARDARGRALPAAADDVMLPVGFEDQR